MYIVADIGGTKSRIAGSTDLATLSDPIIIDTPQEYQAGLSAITEAARSIAQGAPIVSVSIGLPGAFDRERCTLLQARNLPAWKGKSVVADLEKALGARVYAANDVALIALGEAHHGAGKGAGIVVYMTVSTGVNAARIVEGCFDTSVFGSETGGQYIFHDGRFLEFEQLVSGKSIEEKYKKHPKELGLGHPVWEELAETVALGLYNSILHWSPERVVLGGSMFNEIGISVESVRLGLERINKKFPSMPEVVHSALGDIGGLYGGMVALKQSRH